MTGILTADLAESQAIQVRSADPATAGLETVLAGMLADVVHADRVPAGSNFFEDLGADSLVMAQFCARVRKRPGLPPVSMKDIYRHPTISSLAAALTDTAPAPAGPPAAAAGAAAPAEPPAGRAGAAAPTAAAAPAGVAARAGTLRYVSCGTLQLLCFLGYVYVAALAFSAGYKWISASPGLADGYLRSAAFGGAIFLAACTFPIVAKWVLIGRWKPRQIRIWSLGYVRFWVVKTLVASNPLVLFAGSPLYVLYLRALGAKVGRGAAIFSRHAPVCTDLLTIGAGTVIRKDSFFSCYRAQAGLIQTGPVTLGRDVFVGEQTVLDIGTSMGDGAQLGHASSLHAGQAVPAGQRWHGSPAVRTEADYRGAGPARCGTGRRAAYTVLQLLTLLCVYLPLAAGGVVFVFAAGPRLAALLAPGPLGFTSWPFYVLALAVSLVLFAGYALVRCLVLVTVPRVLNLAIEPGKVYRLYGFHYAAHRTIARLTNSKFAHKLTGDSSYIVHYLRCLGYKLSPVVQTGSNFGNEVKHETPYLASVGTGTQVASGLSVINADFSGTSFRVSRAAIGPRNFLGNQITYPSQGKTGDNCLLATKVLVPIDGPVRQDVGLLGSPSFEIPRTVQRDARFAHLASGDQLRRGLAAKNKYNLRTAGLFLLARWFYVFALTLGFLFMDLSNSIGAAPIVLADVLILVFSVVYLSLVERAATGFRALRPTYCPIYQIDFWRTERFFKLKAEAGLHRLFTGTPFKSVLWRLVGVRLGRRLFDDGAGMSEKNMVTIGDDVTLNNGTTIQCHSQEDYAFKSDRITIGAGCTVGVGAFVHYGVTMGDGAVLAPDSFLMKGEEIPPHTQWGGNPAQPI